MGVYLSSPIIEKVSDDKKCTKFNYGASSMQGWRMTQEDAHNCISDYDSGTNTSYFAVYDGHGGAEVAQYTASHLPEFIKNHQLYKEDKLAEALQEAFLDFDARLTQDSVVQELKTLAGVSDDDDHEDEEEIMGRTERDMLVAEANMPIEELMAKYNSTPAAPQVKKLQKDKFQSPAIRAKNTSSSENGDGAQPSGSGSDQVATRLEDRLEQPDNDNNLNVEKELRDSQSAVKTTKYRTVEPDSSTNNVKSNVNNSKSSETKTPAAAVLVENGETKSSDASEKLADKSADESVKSESVEPDSTSDKSAVKSQDTCSTTAPLKQEVEVSQSGSSSIAALTLYPSSSSLKAGSSSGSELSDSGVGSSSSVGVSAGSSKESAAGTPSCSQSGSSASLAGSSSSGAGSLSSSVLTAGSSSAGSSSSGSSLEASGSCEVGGSGVQASGSGLCKPSGSKKSLADEDFDSDEETTDEDDDEYMSASDEDDDDEDDEDEEEDGPTSGMLSFRNVPGSDDHHVEEPGTDSGCTAVVLLMRQDKLFVANAGDSRCVLCRGGTAVELSFDHKPEDQVERSRIEAAGGKVTNDGRVNGGLNLSRALGDHWYKRNETKDPREQMISALPDIESTTLVEQDEFLIIACDGIWNYMTSQETVDFVRDKLKDPTKFEKPSLVCEELFDHCLAPNTMGDGTGCDNMTCIVVAFKRPANNSSSIKRDNEEVDKSDTEAEHDEKRAKIESDEPEGHGN